MRSSTTGPRIPRSRCTAPSVCPTTSPPAAGPATVRPAGCWDAGGVRPSCRRRPARPSRTRAAPASSAVARSLLPRIREVQRDVASYNQKVVFEVHPELGFYQLNDDVPLRYGKRTMAGTAERLAILQDRIPGLARVLDSRPERHQPASPARCLCRPVDGPPHRGPGHHRVPDDPEWNEDGLRMEFAR